MKMTGAKNWLAAGLSGLTVMAVMNAAADQPAGNATPNEKSYTGVVTSIDPKEHALSVKGGMMSNKEFNLGGNCFYSQVEKNNATPNDLRAGEKVTVNYQNAHGVLIASRVEQEPMRFEGTVKAIDTDKHTLVLHRTALDKELELPGDCKVMLHEGKSGTLADIKAGNHVTVTFETPADVPTARQIAQTSIPFTGTLTAIDLNDKTLKAKSAFASKKFNVADDCAIVINGRADGKLGDLKPNEKLVLSYDEINGVNIVNRIAPAQSQADSVATYGADTMPPVMGY